VRVKTEGFFSTFDSTQLFFRSWAPQSGQQSDKALIVLHRGHEHSGRLEGIVEGLKLSDYWAFAYDARGHGKSPGMRGHAEDFSYLVRDLDAFVAMISERHGIPVENMVVVANSVGAVVASTWAHDYAPRIRAMVLAAPAFRIKLYVPFALAGLRILNMIKKPAFISSYVKSRMLTHDIVEARRYNEDPLITRDIAVNVLLGLHDASTRVIEGAGSIVTPTFLLSAGRDFVVKLSAQKRFFDRLGATKKEMKIFSRFFHGVFYEQGKEEGLKLARAFIQDAMSKPVDRAALLEAHRQSPSRAIYEALLKPAGIIKSISFAMQRLSMSTIGRISQGVTVGLETGFDSGLSLDYVYENKPRGRFGIGRIIDFFYLNAVGWKGIRIRKVNIETQIEKAIQEQAKLMPKGQPIRVLDVAGGAGRYLLDVAARNRDLALEFLICDNVAANLSRAAKTAKELGLHNVRFMVADAFAPANAAPGFTPDIVVISGFFELFQDNELIRRCVARVAAISSPTAQLVYTGQSYHPQQEMIARTLRNRDGAPWIMRLRSQAEVDEIFSAHGFEKCEMSIDTFGIFTVSRAQKRQVVNQAAQAIRSSARDHASDHSAAL
jgi:alpha-beta hydrolase superfamily lysophospholipase